MLYTASIVHVLAALVELGAELQRKRLKDDYRNGRELCTTGLWGVVRRPHFACNVVHGAAYGVAAGGGGGRFWFCRWACIWGRWDGVYVQGFIEKLSCSKEKMSLLYLLLQGCCLACCFC